MFQTWNSTNCNFGYIIIWIYAWDNKNVITHISVMCFHIRTTSSSLDKNEQKGKMKWFLIWRLFHLLRFSFFFSFNSSSRFLTIFSFEEKAKKIKCNSFLFHIFYSILLLRSFLISFWWVRLRTNFEKRF